MKVLWEIAPASVNQIAEITSHWHPKTVRTMLIRLDKKGVVGFTLDNGIQHYAPKLTREECEAQATESFLQRVFNRALTPMVAYFSRKALMSVTGSPLRHPAAPTVAGTIPSPVVQPLLCYPCPTPKTGNWSPRARLRCGPTSPNTTLRSRHHPIWCGGRTLVTGPLSAVCWCNHG